MPRAKVVPLIIGIGSHVIALDQATGAELWRTKLRSGSYITICRTNGRIFAGVSGELYCLDERGGAILWHNKLKGLGQGLIAFGATDAPTSATAAIAATQTAAAAAVIAASA